MRGAHTQTEIATQVDAWTNAVDVIKSNEAAIRSFWRNGGYDTVIFTGCGSTHYLSMIAANYMQSTTGIAARAVPASELIFHPEAIYAKNSKPLLVTISRSAETTETVRAARAFKDQYGDHVVTIANYGDRPLNEFATLELIAPAGQEQSVAQTRSFSAMTVLAEGFIRVIGGQSYAQTSVKRTNADIQSLADFVEPYSNPANYSQYFYLGSGPRFGLAEEAMLKMKEMSLTYAEAYHPMEFRHGPMSMVDQQTVVVGLLGEEAYEAERTVFDEMKALGAATLCIAPNSDADYVVDASPSLPTLVQYLPMIQWLAFSRAIQKGLDPDNPRNLTSVVHLQDEFSG